MVKLKIHRKRSCKSWLPRLQEVINAPPLRAREWHDPDMQPVKHREVTKNINPHIRSPLDDGVDGGVCLGWHQEGAGGR